MYACDSWTIKKAKWGRIDAFELWCWRRLLRVPWTARRLNPSILNGIIHWNDWCWNWNSNTLATWCEELTHWKRPWCWERLKSGGEGKEISCKEDEMVGWHHWRNGHEFEQALGVGDGQGGLMCYSPQYCRVGHDWATELNWFIFLSKKIITHIKSKKNKIQIVQ